MIPNAIDLAIIFHSYGSLSHLTPEFVSKLIICVYINFKLFYAPVNRCRYSKITFRLTTLHSFF